MKGTRSSRHIAVRLVLLWSISTMAAGTLLPRATSLADTESRKGSDYIRAMDQYRIKSDLEAERQANERRQILSQLLPGLAGTTTTSTDEGDEATTAATPGTTSTSTSPPTSITPTPTLAPTSTTITPNTTTHNTTLPPSTSHAPTNTSSSLPIQTAKDTTAIVYVTMTDSGGQVTTSTIAPVASDTSSSSTSGATGRTWGIVGGVLGGVLLIAAIGYAVYRLTQRRFSQLDDIGDEIKWPELQQDFAATSTLNPSGTRRTGGAGIEMGEMDEAEQDVEAGDYGHGYEPVGYGGAQKGGYYDNYLGASSAPSPSPQNLYAPNMKTADTRYQDGPSLTPAASNSSLSRSGKL